MDWTPVVISYDTSEFPSFFLGSFERAARELDDTNQDMKRVRRGLNSQR